MEKLNINRFNSVHDLAYVINQLLDVDWFEGRLDDRLHQYIYDISSDAPEDSNIYYESDLDKFINLIKVCIDNEIEDIDKYFTY